MISRDKFLSFVSGTTTSTIEVHGEPVTVTLTPADTKRRNANDYRAFRKRVSRRRAKKGYR